MTDLAGALAPTENLPPFDGRPVVRTTIKVTKAGDGLSVPLQLDPQTFRIGQKVTLVLDCVVSDVDHKVAKGYSADEPDAPLQRLHTFETTGAMVIPREVVAKHLDEQAEQIKRAREEAEGIQRLPGSDGWGDQDEGLDLEDVDGDEEDGEVDEPIRLLPGLPTTTPDDDLVRIDDVLTDAVATEDEAVEGDSPEPDGEDA